MAHIHLNALDHCDSDGDGKCDYCSKVLNPSANCGCSSLLKYNFCIKTAPFKEIISKGAVY